MIQQGHIVQLARYKALRESEPELRRLYQARDIMNLCREVNEDDDREDPDDIAARERYVIASTGAVLTYNTGVGLLNHLCSLIPRDTFTPAHLPKYSGDFRATLELPSSLPLPPELLVFIGPEKRSKKEAKRAVAFMAVKKLHELNVFDDYLLPARGPSGASSEDADGRSLMDVRHVPDMMDVLVREPWAQGGKLFLHVIWLDGIPAGGLVTASLLPTVDMVCDGMFLSMSEGTLVHFDQADEWRQRRMIQDYTRMGLWWCVTIKGISLPLTCSLVPITASHCPDFETVERALLYPYGTHDWTGIDESYHDRRLLRNAKVYGRPLLLRRIRRDLSPLSKPLPGSREAQFPTYHDYYTEKYTRKGVKPNIPREGPLLEVQVFPREQSSSYSLKSLHGAEDKRIKLSVTNASLLPQGLCRWMLMSKDLYQTFQLLPKLMHRITDRWRAQRARAELHLPPIHDDLLVEALTLPSAGAGFNNQRFETLGDSVLKLSTVVYLYNKFPHRHEGQLDALRRTCVSNRTLLAKAKEVGLEHFLTSENQSLRVWRYTAAEDVDISDPTPFRYTKRCFPRRSLQDCMEAILGASFATAGLPMALRAGTALGLCFGGPIPWPLRYGWKVERSPLPPLFLCLQETLGYEFKCGELLVEAVTHPSFRSGATSSYQRLEFLGDGKKLLTMNIISCLSFGSFGRSSSYAVPLQKISASRFRSPIMGPLPRCVQPSPRLPRCQEARASQDPPRKQCGTERCDQQIHSPSGGYFI
jgi:endoribonuclease Dicer